MFTTPTIVTNDDLNTRSYVTFYFNNERKREYHGKAIGLNISPNRAKSINQRNELLEKLRYEYHKALETCSYPLNSTDTSVSILNKGITKYLIADEVLPPPAIVVLFKATKNKLRASLSRTYKRNLKYVYRQFRAFITEEEAQGPLISIASRRIDQFLSQFGSSGTYYMNKRRDLGVLFSAAGRLIDKPVSSVKSSERRRVKAKLHLTYEKEQLKPILNYLKVRYPNLYICCLLTYSSWLRPHEEIRLLTRNDFKKDDTEVHLTGTENKGGKVRVVYIPDYVRKELFPILSKLGKFDNIFSQTSEPFNDAYFNTMWTRAWRRMHELDLIDDGQTIYSFRHTAAVSLYRRNKDVFLLQKLLGHSSITVTLNYLRGLGELSSDDLKNAAPEL